MIRHECGKGQGKLNKEDLLNHPSSNSSYILSRLILAINIRVIYFLTFIDLILRARSWAGAQRWIIIPTL